MPATNATIAPNIWWPHLAATLEAGIVADNPATLADNPALRPLIAQRLISEADTSPLWQWLTQPRTAAHAAATPDLTAAHIDTIINWATDNFTSATHQDRDSIDAAAGALCANPNISLDNLRQLVGIVPKHVTAHPSCAHLYPTTTHGGNIVDFGCDIVHTINPDTNADTVLGCSIAAAVGIAANPATNSLLIGELARLSLQRPVDDVIRDGVADAIAANPNTPCHILEQLAPLRQRPIVAANPNTPGHILEQIVAGGNTTPSTWAEVVAAERNPNLPAELIEAAAHRSTQHRKTHYIWANPSLNAKLRTVALNGPHDIRSAYATNPTITPEELDALIAYNYRAGHLRRQRVVHYPTWESWANIIVGEPYSGDIYTDLRARPQHLPPISNTHYTIMLRLGPGWELTIGELFNTSKELGE